MPRGFNTTDLHMQGTQMHIKETPQFVQHFQLELNHQINTGRVLPLRISPEALPNFIQ